MQESNGPGGQSRHGHETTDANIRNLIIFGIGLGCLVIAGLLIAKGVFHWFVEHQGLGPPASPFENVRSLPPEPRLQVSSPKDLKKYKDEQERILSNYAWVDRNAGIVRIPIDRAMDILLQKGLPVRAASSPHQNVPETSATEPGEGAETPTRHLIPVISQPEQPVQ